MKRLASARMDPCLFLACFFPCDVSFSRHLDLITLHTVRKCLMFPKKKKGKHVVVVETEQPQPSETAPTM